MRFIMKTILRIKLIALSLTIFSFTLSAQTLDGCIEQAKNFSPQDSIESSCFSVFLESAPLNTRLSLSPELELVAYKNIIFTQGPDTLRVIAGDKTGLEEIQSFAVDRNQERIAVLNKVKGEEKSELSVLTYNLSRHGNVVPSNIIRLNFDDLSSPKKVIFSDCGDFLFVVARDQITQKRLLASFETSMDSRSAMDEKRPEVVSVIGRVGPALEESVEVEVYPQGLMLFNPVQNHLYIYELSGQNFDILPTWTMDISQTLGKEAVEVKYLDQKIVIKDSEGKDYFFDLPHDSTEGAE